MFKFFDLPSDLIMSLAVDWLDEKAYGPFCMAIRKNAKEKEQSSLMVLKEKLENASEITSGTKMNFQEKLALIFLALPPIVQKPFMESNLKKIKDNLNGINASPYSNSKHRLVVSSFLYYLEEKRLPDFSEEFMSQVMDELIYGDAGLQQSLLGFVCFFSNEQWSEFADKIIAVLKNEPNPDDEEDTHFRYWSRVFQVMDVFLLTMPFMKNREKRCVICSELLGKLINADTDGAMDSINEFDLCEQIKLILNAASSYLNSKEKEIVFRHHREMLSVLRLPEHVAMVGFLLVNEPAGDFKELLNASWDQLFERLNEEFDEVLNLSVEILVNNSVFMKKVLNSDFLKTLCDKINGSHEIKDNCVLMIWHLIPKMPADFINTCIHIPSLVKKIAFDQDSATRISRRFRLFTSLAQSLSTSNKITLLNTVHGVDTGDDNEKNYWQQAALNAIRESIPCDEDAQYAAESSDSKAVLETAVQSNNKYIFCFLACAFNLVNHQYEKTIAQLQEAVHLENNGMILSQIIEALLKLNIGSMVKIFFDSNFLPLIVTKINHENYEAIIQIMKCLKMHITNVLMENDSVNEKIFFCADIISSFLEKKSDIDHYTWLDLEGFFCRAFPYFTAGNQHKLVHSLSRYPKGRKFLERRGLELRGHIKQNIMMDDIIRALPEGTSIDEVIKLLFIAHDSEEYFAQHNLLKKLMDNKKYDTLALCVGNYALQYPGRFYACFLVIEANIIEAANDYNIDRLKNLIDSLEKAFSNIRSYFVSKENWNEFIEEYFNCIVKLLDNPSEYLGCYILQMLQKSIFNDSVKNNVFFVNGLLEKLAKTQEPYNLKHNGDFSEFKENRCNAEAMNLLTQLIEQGVDFRGLPAYGSNTVWRQVFDHMYEHNPLFQQATALNQQNNP